MAVGYYLVTWKNFAGEFRSQIITAATAEQAKKVVKRAYKYSTAHKAQPLGYSHTL